MNDKTPPDADAMPPLDKMRTASYLLPDPGGEVMRQCVDRIAELERPTEGK